MALFSVLVRSIIIRAWVLDFPGWTVVITVNYNGIGQTFVYKYSRVLHEVQ